MISIQTAIVIAAALLGFNICIAAVILSNGDRRRIADLENENKDLLEALESGVRVTPAAQSSGEKGRAGFKSLSGGA
jgi:hypothetical protein